jgi:hypothetical protein
MISFCLMMLMAVAALSVVSSGEGRVHSAARTLFDVQGSELCEGGTQNLVLNLWIPFKSSQTFAAMDSALGSASESAPAGAVTGTIDGNLSYASAVISYAQVDSYTRTFTIRTVGWADLNGNGQIDPGEPQKVVDVSYTFALARSQVFDYAYFVNNYGWMDGFGPNDLVVNGDMRANGNFSITDGAPTINGSVFAAQNNNLVPASQGVVNAAPVKWTNSQYATNQASADPMAADNEDRWRPAYNATADGAYGSALYAQTGQTVFDANGQILNNQLAGTALGDITGLRSWTSSSPGVATTTQLSSTPTQQVVMPDLNNVGSPSDAPDPNGSYCAQSEAYTDPTQTYSDGTTNPLYGQGAFLQVWNSAANAGAGAYQTLTTSGVVSGSAIAVGTAAHPILIHGPVTVTQDLVITGNVSGQGTVYTGRNVQITGSIVYTNKPDFSTSDPLGAANQKADLLGLAASGSVIMGDTSQFSWPYPLEFMEPPFTLGRYDDEGNWIPPYNATNVDSTGNMLYQSVVGDATIHALSTGINQIDAVLYTNFVGGGDLATGGNGITLNGSIISKDEAMVVWSLPMRENYDMRIKERNLTTPPLIDINLPRSPTLIQNSWQDRGFSIATSSSSSSSSPPGGTSQS